MQSVAMRDIFTSITLTKWTFSVPFTAIIAVPFFMLGISALGIEFAVIENYTHAHPGISFAVMSLFLLPFFFFASYVHERFVRPRILSRGWNDDGFFPALLIMAISMTLFVVIPVALLILSALYL